MGNKINTCNICYDKKLNNYKKCNLCKNCIVCNICLDKMEANLKEKCPVCRQKNWIKMKINQKLPKKIVPINKNEDNQIETNDIINSSYSVVDFFKTFKLIIQFIVYLFTIWIIGVLTVICLTNDRSYFGKNYSYIWISLLVGLSEFFIFWCCCCRNVNLIEIICKYN